MAVWLRLLALGGVAAALAVASAVASATESGGAPQVSSSAPDPVSARVDVNGFSTSGGSQTAQLTICFDKQIQTISTPGSTFAEHLRFIGYGGYGGNSTKGTAQGLAHTAGTPGAVAGGATLPGPNNGGAPATGVGGIAAPTFSPDQTLQVKAGATPTLDVPNTGVGSNTGGGNQPWGAASSDPNTRVYNVTAFTGNNPNCVIVQIAATGGAAGLDVLQFSQVAVDEGAATGLRSGTDYSTPATLALTSAAGPSEVASSKGASTGPKLVQGVFAPNTSPNTLTYVFNMGIDPGTAAHVAITPGRFCYVDSGGVEHCGNNASLNSQNSVTVTFTGGNVSNPAYYEVYPGAVYSEATGVPDPGTATGSTVASIPTLQSATPVAGTPGSYDLVYDQCVNFTGTGAGNDLKFLAVLEDNTVVKGATSSRVGNDCRTVRVSFGSVANFSNFASKVVKIVDAGGAVVSQGSGKGSAVGEGDAIAPPNMSPGNTDGPNLTGFKVDTSQNAAFYFFDNQYGALAQNAAEPVAKALGLIYKDGTNSLDNKVSGTATFVAPNEVKVAFPASAMGTSSNPVVGGLVGSGDPDEALCSANQNPAPANTVGCDGSYAVQDYQNKGNVSPLASGVGQGTSSTTTTTVTSSGSTTTVTSRTTSTTTTTGGRGRRVSGKVGLLGRRLRVSHGRVTVRFSCASNKACFGLFSITYHVKTLHHHTVTAVCTVSRSAKYRVGAHKTKTVSAPVHGPCVSAIRRHHGHLRAKLTTRPRSGQHGLVANVTLVL